MLTIGFAGTFYTLWNIESERVNVSLGAWYEKVTCTYYKNLSKNLDEAIKKSGIANVDESLKGKRKSFEFKKPLVIEPKVMTDREILFKIILVNDKENTLEKRKEALQRLIDLAYMSFDKQQYFNNEFKWVEVDCYCILGDLRCNDVWYHSQLGIYINGCI